MLAPFDEQDQEGLRFLGFTISVTRNGERAVVTGEMKVEIYRSGAGEDELTLVITLPNGQEIAEAVRREMLQEAADDSRDV